jgi:hypothetical protein
LLSKFDKSGGGKAKEAKETAQAPAAISWNAGLAIAFGATVSIDLIDIRLEPLLGANGVRPPMLRLELMNLKLHSTDDKWRKVPLNKSWEISQSNKDAVQVFKEVSIDSISVSFESEEHSSAILTLPLLVRLHLSLSRAGLLPRSIFVEAFINSCSLKLGSDEVRHLLVFLLSLERCLQRSNKPEKKTEIDRESSEFMAVTRGRSHSAADAISDITDRFTKANIAEELSRELSSGGVSEAGLDEDLSSAVGADGLEDAQTGDKVVPTFKLRFSANEIRLDLMLGDGDIYVVKISDCGVGNPFLVCAEMGPVDGGNDAVLLSSADSVVVATHVNATIAPIIMERLSRASKDQPVPVMTILSDAFSMSFLHPRPPPPQKGFSIRWDLAQIHIAIPLDDCARLYGMIMSDDVLAWISRDPGIFSRLGLSGDAPPPDPFDISNCEFEARIILKELTVAVPLVHSSIWFENMNQGKCLLYAFRVHAVDVDLASGSRIHEMQEKPEFDVVKSFGRTRNDRGGRVAYLTIETAAVKVCLSSSVVNRITIQTQDLESVAASMPRDVALFVHIPSVMINMQFPLMPIASSIQDQAQSQLQTLTKLVLIKKAFTQSAHIKNRTFILKSHSNCFPASVFIDWMCENGHAASRDDAVLIGRQFLAHQFIRCVGGSAENFSDDDSLYRFYSDETQEFKDRHMWLRILASQEQKILQAKDGLLDELNRDFAAHQHIPSCSNPFALHCESPGKVSIMIDCSIFLDVMKSIIPLLNLFSLHAGLAHIAMLGLIDMNNRRCLFAHPNFTTCLIAPTHLAINALFQSICVRVVLKSSVDSALSTANADERVNMDVIIGSTQMSGDAPPDLMMLKMRRLWEDSNGIQPQAIPQLNLKITIDSIGVSLSIPQVSSCPLPVIFHPNVDGRQQILLDISMSVDGATPSVEMRSFLDGMFKINKRLAFVADGPIKDESSSASQKPNIVLVRVKVEGLCACFSADVFKHTLKGVIATASCLDQGTLLKLADVFGSLSVSGLVLLSNAYLTSARMCLQHLTSVEVDSALANDTSINIFQIWQQELKHQDEEQVRSVNDHLLRALWCLGIGFHGSSFSVQVRASHLSPNYLDVKIDSVAARAAFIQQLRSKFDLLPDFSVLELSAPSIEPIMRRIIQTFVVLGAQVFVSLGTCKLSSVVIGEATSVPALRLSEIGIETSAFLNPFPIGSSVSQNLFWEDVVGRVDFSGKDSDGSLNFLITAPFVQEVFHAFATVEASVADILSLFELKFPPLLLSSIALSFARNSILSKSSAPRTATPEKDSVSPSDDKRQHERSSSKFGSTIHPPLSDSSRSLNAVRKLDDSLGILQRVNESAVSHTVQPSVASNISSKLTMPKPIPAWAASVTAKSSDHLTTGFPWSHSFSETSLIEGSVRFCRCERDGVKKGSSGFFNRAPRVDWLAKWAVVRSSGSLLLFDDSSASSPPSVRLDMTFVQYHLVASDSSKHPSLWTQSSSGDCIFIRPPVGSDLFLTVSDDSSSGNRTEIWMESFRKCELEVRVQKAMKDEAAASFARINALRNDQIGGHEPSSLATSSSISVRDVVPALVDIITYARDEAILAHHDLSSARVELDITKRALASSAQDLQTLRGLLQQREDELLASMKALNDAVVLKQNAMTDANRAKAYKSSSSINLSPAIRPSLSLPLHVGALGKVSTDAPSEDDEISITLSSRVNLCSTDLLLGGFAMPSAQEVRTCFTRRVLLCMNFAFQRLSGTTSYFCLILWSRKQF